MIEEFGYEFDDWFWDVADEAVVSEEERDVGVDEIAWLCAMSAVVSDHGQVVRGAVVSASGNLVDKVDLETGQGGQILK